MLVPFDQLLADARAGGYAVGYFEPWDIYSMEAVAEAAHPAGVAVDAELCALPDGSGELGGEVGHMTDPDEAARFVAETGVDTLAVSVGNIHILL